MALQDGGCRAKLDCKKKMGYKAKEITSDQLNLQTLVLAPQLVERGLRVVQLAAHLAVLVA